MLTDVRKIELNNRGGRSRAFLLRRCGVGDLPAIVQLQDAVIASLEAGHVFAKTSTEEIEESLREDVCFGAFCGGKLSAAAIMVVNRVTPRNLGTHLGYDEARMRRCATYDSVFILPQFRGYGLQRLLCEIMDGQALRLGCGEALATVSPDNAVSLGNMRARGFEILTEKVMYTGVRRYIIRKSLTQASPEPLIKEK